ncbi:MAG: bifunctional phosphopantothenoylcysteine decarboxylase/phosphopantothenate--cysteine ligase CoaBC [Bacteroidota bacterium]
MLTGKKIILGVSGGIAAIKIPLLIRELRRNGVEVYVVMTKAAAEFVTPLSLSALSLHPVVVDIFPKQNTEIVETSTWHIHLAESADCMLIAPATANTIAKIAHGYSDDALSTLAIALRSPLILAPSMDGEMWMNQAVQKNVTTLKEFGCFILPPEEGALASGLTGIGRLPDIEVIIKYLDDVLSKNTQDFSSKNVLITAGPTYEPIDAVRFIGNRSSGKMGFALASAASIRGANVTLISGTTHLSTPRNVRRINVETAEEMFHAVKEQHKKNDIIIMSAAVSDFTPINVALSKIKKESISGEEISLRLKKTMDILKFIGENKRKNTFLAGFALETENLIANGKKKLLEKKLDMIICNNANVQGAGFSIDTNVVSVITNKGEVVKLPQMHKFDVANEILNHISREMND